MNLKRFNLPLGTVPTRIRIELKGFHSNGRALLLQRSGTLCRARKPHYNNGGNSETARLVPYTAGSISVRKPVAEVTTATVQQLIRRNRAQSKTSQGQVSNVYFFQLLPDCMPPLCRPSSKCFKYAYVRILYIYT